MSKFSEKLNELGFGSYADYLDSPHWLGFRERYRSSGLPMRCKVCGLNRIQLHHHTYERLGREELADVTPLCRDHHESVHEWLKTSGKRWVHFTHLAIAALRGEELPARVPRNQTPGKKARKREKHRKRERERVERIEKNRAIADAEKTAKIKRAAESLRIYTQIIGFALKGCQYRKAENALKNRDVNGLRSLLAKVCLQGIAKTLVKRERPGPVSRPRATTPFSPNAQAAPDPDTASQAQRMRDVIKKEGFVPVPGLAPHDGKNAKRLRPGEQSPRRNRWCLVKIRPS